MYVGAYNMNINYNMEVISMHFTLPKENKEQVIENIMTYFYEEHGEEIGHLAAENFLLFAIREIGPHVYNQGVKDAKVVLEQKLMNIEEDLTSLEKPLQRRE